MREQPSTDHHCHTVAATDWSIVRPIDGERRAESRVSAAAVTVPIGRNPGKRARVRQAVTDRGILAKWRRRERGRRDSNRGKVGRPRGARGGGTRRARRCGRRGEGRPVERDGRLQSLGPKFPRSFSPLRCSRCLCCYCCLFPRSGRGRLGVHFGIEVEVVL